MAFIPIPSAAKVDIQGTWQSQQVKTVLHFGYITAPVESNLVDLATDVFQNFDAGLQSSRASNYSTDRVVATSQQSETAPVGVYLPSAPRVGTGGSTSVPLNAAWAFTHRTALRGRSFRGRTYLPGLTSSILDDAGEGDLATLAGIASIFVTHFITSPPSDWAWGVATRFTDHFPRAQGFLTPVIAVAVDTLLDSQRRRLKARGR